MIPARPFPLLITLLALAPPACAQTEPPEVPTLLRGMEPDVEEIDMRRTPVVRAVERSRDAVVSIYITRDPESLERGVDGQGSGVILDEAGLVITNWHVVVPVTTGARSAVVRLRNGAQYRAGLLSSSPEHDLALLQLETDERLSAIDVGDSDTLMVGETVIAIGNPQGLSNSVTVGVLSSTDRSITVRAPDGFVRRYEGLLQTDAAINEGNSGGALLDITGRLIGINNAMARGVENIGYAIPINTVRRVFEEVLVSSENLASVWLGMRVRERDGAAVVEDVVAGGPAARGGVREGDRIRAASGRPVRTALDYARATIGARAGERFSLEVDRDRRALELAVVPLSIAEWDLLRRTGLTVAVVTAREDRELLEAASVEAYSGSGRRRVPLLPSVLRVREVAEDSTADSLGIRPGDVIVAAAERSFFGVRFRPMRSVEELADACRDRAGRSLHVLLLRDGEGLTGELEVLLD